MPCELDEDGTGGLNRAGDVVLHVPAAHETSLVLNQLAGWLRSEHAIWIYRARDATRVSRSYPDARPPD